MGITPEHDGLIAPEVGQWSKRKYHFLSRYLDLFSTGMKYKWPERHYIDLFAGAGMVTLRGTRELAFGSTMIAATVRDPFTHIHACELDGAKSAALDLRLRRLSLPNPPHVLRGDANKRIRELLAPIPRRGALCITFADPYGLHLDFATVEQVAGLQSDLIVLLADNMDAVRNWAAYYFNNADSSLDRFMGEGGWREELTKLATDRQAAAIRTRYEQKLGELGYQFFEHQRVWNQRGRDIYTLLYASRSSVGLKFWREASKVDEGGQRSMFQ